MSAVRHPPSWAAAVAVIVAVSSTTPLRAQYLVKDINTTPGLYNPDSSPADFATVGGLAYFRARREDLGAELWRTNGTTAGTTLQADINPGVAGSSPTGMTPFGGAVYFSANDGTSGIELWKTTGPSAVRVADIAPGSGSSFPGGFTAVGATLFFVASTGAAGFELWKTDGTPGGTVLVMDIRPGSAGSAPNELTALGNILFFTADDGTRGRELWRSDGTAAGTYLVEDIRAGSATSGPSGLMVFGNALCFAADDGTNGKELWRSAGSALTTSLLADINPGAPSSNPTYLCRGFGSLFYFSANDGQHGQELWRSDGTTAGTWLTRDLRAGSAGSFPSGLTLAGSWVYFSADDGVTGRELYQAQMTSQGFQLTFLLMDINPTGDSNPEEFTALGSSVYFRATGGLTALLFVSNGLASNTVPVLGGVIDPVQLAAFGTQLLFSADGAMLGREPWHATLASASPVADINPVAGTKSSAPMQFAGLGDILLFEADDGIAGWELWRSDGTAPGTTMVKDILAGPEASFPHHLTPMNGMILFAATDVAHGMELWRTDGTEAGTRMVRDVQVGTNPSNPWYLTAVNGTLFFAADDGVHGAELWRSDGTLAGTGLVRDIFPGATSSSACLAGVAQANGLLFFLADDGVHGAEIWKSDGTEAGTQMVRDVVPGPGDSWPTAITAVGSTVFFVLATDGALWKTDGSPAGTVPVKSGLYIDRGTLTAVGSTLFFAADDFVSGLELWKSNGTTAGTQLVRNIHPTGDGVPPTSVGSTGFTAAGGVLFFPADDGTHGLELWRSDGTLAGTTMVKDVHPSGAGIGHPNSQSISVPVGQVGSASRVAFEGGTSISGREPYYSDGTTAGTHMVADINPGSGDSQPSQFLTVGSNVFFTANDGATGIELWVLPLAQVGAPNLVPYGAACAGTGGVLPRMNGSGQPTLANGSFRIRVFDARPSSAAVLMLSDLRLGVPLPGGCTLLQQPLFTLGAGSDARGLVDVAMPIPNLPELAGAALFFQGAIVDPGGAFLGLVSMSDGLQVIVGR